MRKLLLIPLLVISILSLGASPVEAHILKTDGSIGAVIHINPDDDPYVGEVADFYFEIKDKSGKFNSSNCSCAVSILRSRKEIFSAPLIQETGLTSESFSFTFREKAVYTLVLKGTPKEPDAFQPFNITYDLRVSRERLGNSSDSKGDSSGLYMTIGLIIAAVATFSFIFRLKRKSKESVSEKSTNPKFWLLIIIATFVLHQALPSGFLLFRHHENHDTQQSHSSEHPCCMAQPIVPITPLGVESFVDVAGLLLEIEHESPSLSKFRSIDNKSPPDAA
ncbi:MAG: hypothetical protein WD231_05235 [Candidatus Woykebacteria bacterium]